MKYNFTKPTCIFAIIGVFIGGFTAIGLLETQKLLTHLGIECTIAWEIIWITTSIAALILPFLFYRNTSVLSADKVDTLATRLMVFNLLEYTFIQSSLTPLLASSQTLCYASDGQNGLEVIFSAWLALPILICLSRIFSKTIKMTNVKP